MENPIIEENYEEAKRKAKEFYLSIGSVWCPALGQQINFNRIGFQHLLQKERRFRPRSEQMRRFALLSHAKEMVSDYRGDVVYEERKVFRHREIDGKDIPTFSTMHFWAFADRRDSRNVRLVIRQLDGGEKHFFSIFEENKKSTRRK